MKYKRGSPYNYFPIIDLASCPLTHLKNFMELSLYWTTNCEHCTCPVITNTNLFTNTLYCSLGVYRFYSIVIITDREMVCYWFGILLFSLISVLTWDKFCLVYRLFLWYNLWNRLKGGEMEEEMEEERKREIEHVFVWVLYLKQCQIKH